MHSTPPLGQSLVEVGRRRSALRHLGIVSSQRRDAMVDHKDRAARVVVGLLWFAQTCQALELMFRYLMQLSFASVLKRDLQLIHVGGRVLSLSQLPFASHHLAFLHG
mmetsp:Transcript_110826/g.353149  ORF Transcript_110826/g.353149 Transcript_110826/m.353149 type:complete len:107 (-) Transcript_110826:4100-4420(-)